MTREEAIIQLKELKEHCSEMPTQGEIWVDDVNALDMAIKALEENKKLKNRCLVLSNGTMCLFCPMECENRSCDFRNKGK